MGLGREGIGLPMLDPGAATRELARKASPRARKERSALDDPFRRERDNGVTAVLFLLPQIRAYGFEVIAKLPCMRVPCLPDFFNYRILPHHLLLLEAPRVNR